MSEDFIEQLAQQVGLARPLALEEQLEGTYRLFDPEMGDDYGRFLTNTHELWIYSVVEGSGMGMVRFDYESICSIHTSKIGEITIEFQNGAYSVCKKQTKIPDDVRFDPTMDYAHPTLEDLRYMLYNKYGDLKDFVYYDVIKGVPVFDLSIFGRTGVVAYQGKKSNQLTRIVRELQQEHTVVEKKGIQFIQKLRFSRDDVDFILKEIIEENPRNIFVETLRRVQWDGTPRVDSFLQTIGGYGRNVGDDQKMYLAVVMRIFLLSVLERNLGDGAKSIQAMLVLIGAQNSHKSGFCKRMSFYDSYGWFVDSTASFADRKKLLESASGSLVTELIESIQLEQPGMENNAKATIDMTNARFRDSYAERQSDHRIYFTMVATTNNEVILTDATGNRRYLPVFLDPTRRVRSVWDFSDEEIWQIWAEAKHYYDLGERVSNLMVDDNGNVRKMFVRAQTEVCIPEMGGTALRTYLDVQKPNLGVSV